MTLRGYGDGLVGELLPRTVDCNEGVGALVRVEPMITMVLASLVALGGARTGRADTPFSRLWSGSYQVTPDRSRAPDGRHIRRKPQHQPDRSRTSQPTRRL